MITDTMIEDEKFAELVFSEGNNDIDPNVGIVDNACPKTCAGRKWLDWHVETLDVELLPVKCKEENENFKFGPSEVFNSNKSYQNGH